jgi:PAS domain S-box-containing protein
VRVEWALVAGLGVLLFAGLRLMLRRERSPSAHWIGGWVAAAIGGLLLLLGERWPALTPLALPFGTLFPWFLLAGALALAERAVPRWLLPLGLALGGLRACLALAAGEPLAYAAGFATDLPAILAAAAFARRAVPAEPSAAQRLLAPALVLLTAVGGLHLFLQAAARPHEWLLLLWMFVTPPMLGLQLRVAAEWTRRQLVRARRALEQTIAERTAELARVNESLRRSEERYRTVSELSSDLSFGFRVWKDGRIEGEWVTDAFTRMTGYRLGEVGGDRWLALIHPEDRPVLERGFRAALGANGAGTLVFRIVGKSGEVRWLEARERLTLEPGCLRVVGAARDVTEARRAEEERFRLERQVQEAQRLESLGLVTGGVAHDFNNLLAVILGNGRLALAELPVGHPLRPRLERMLAAAEHGAGLTEQMLVYAGRAPRAQKPVDLSWLVADMLDLARASLPPGVVLREELGPGVWVQGDETQLRQVVLNLVANAGEALDARPGRVEVRTRHAEASAEDLARGRGAPDLAPGRHALLEVVDDGGGMDAETRERVFEPFFTTKLSGRGLGLAAVLGIVRGHGGRVAVASEPGRGSCFRVWLPAGTARLSARAGAPAAPRAARGAARVLVIDDQEPVLDLAREFLSRAGFAVEIALGGRAGLERIRAAAGDFDAVVLDLAMPELDGEQVGRALRALHPELPLLLVSGYEADLAAARYASLAPSRFLRKPFAREELAGALAELLAGVDLGGDRTAS